MWEFRNRNVFGATAFSTYGGFWIGLGLWLHFMPATAESPLIVSLNRDLGWILLAFAIFNTYMLIISSQVNMAVFLVFLTLEVTEILLFIGNFVTKNPALPPFNIAPLPGLIQVGGYVGVLTAVVAWYTSTAGVMNGLKGRSGLPGRQAAVQPLTSRPGRVPRQVPGTRPVPGTLRCGPPIP